MFSEDGSTYLCRISRQLFFQTVFKFFFDFCEFLSVFWFTQILVHFTGPIFYRSDQFSLSQTFILKGPLCTEGLKKSFIFRNSGEFIKQKCFSSKNRSFIPRAAQISRLFVKEGCSHGEVILQYKLVCVIDSDAPRIFKLRNQSKSNKIKYFSKIAVSFFS